jgi:uncharacterized protein (TIRG00374 family)
LSDASPQSPGGLRLSRLLPRLIVAAGLTGWMLWKAHPREVASAAANADWRLILVAVALVLVDRALMAYRWLALLCTVERRRRPPLGSVMRVFFVSSFVGTFLPMSVGSDAVRSYSLTRFNVSGGDAVASVLMDRMLGVASILLMAMLGLSLVTDLASNTGVLVAVGLAALACVVTIATIFSSRAAAALGGIAARLPGPFVRHAAARVLESVRKYSAFPGQLVNVLACSIGVQALRIVQAYYLGRGLGMDVPLTTYVAFIPIILLIMLLPITFNGIGTAQAAFVWLFARTGTPDAVAFALSVLFVSLGIVGNLPGGILYLVGGVHGAEGRQVTL